jgi:hypothetical protein
VFHVSSTGSGQVKWQQVSEDLVPVNITCVQESPQCIFHITAYNSQVDRILDVKLVQPGEATTIIPVRLQLLRRTTDTVQNGLSSSRCSFPMLINNRADDARFNDNSLASSGSLAYIASKRNILIVQFLLRHPISIWALDHVTQCHCVDFIPPSFFYSTTQALASAKRRNVLCTGRIRQPMIRGD